MTTPLEKLKNAFPHFAFTFKIPYYRMKEWRELKTYFNESKMVSKNKMAEIGIYEDLDCLFDIQFYFSLNGEDHAGLAFILNLYNVRIELDLKDVRHWDYEKMVYDE